MLSLLLPGTCTTYNGEEINMENTWISWEDTQDPQGCQAGLKYYEKYSRDPSRTPFQWSSSTNAGFTTGNNTWLPINSNYVTLNLEVQKIVEKSPLKIYKKILETRKFPSVQNGNFTTHVINPNVFAFAR
jgi:alpha-glucosidase